MKNRIFLLGLVLLLTSSLKAQTGNESKTNLIADDKAYGNNSVHYAIAPVPQLDIVSFVLITKKSDQLQFTITDAAGKILGSAPLQTSEKPVFADIPAAAFSETGKYNWLISNAAGSTIATINFTGKNCIPDPKSYQDN